MVVHLTIGALNSVPESLLTNKDKQSSSSWTLFSSLNPCQFETIIVFVAKFRTEICLPSKCKNLSSLLGEILLAYLCSPCCLCVCLSVLPICWHVSTPIWLLIAAGLSGHQHWAVRAYLWFVYTVIYQCNVYMSVGACVHILVISYIYLEWADLIKVSCVHILGTADVTCNINSLCSISWMCGQSLHISGKQGGLFTQVCHILWQDKSEIYTQSGQD